MRDETSHQPNEATDPVLDALLYEALTPDQAPDGLNERVLAATTPRLGGAPEDRPAVIGRIGVGRSAWRFAAAAALAIGVGWLAWPSGGPVTPGPGGDALVVSPEAIEADLARLAAAEAEAAWLDERLELLAWQVESADAADPRAAASWDADPFESLDRAMAFETYETLVDEAAWYF
ncbi:MAG: hypothetical protein AAF710_08075 [Planctomycetota bacterium]